MAGTPRRSSAGRKAGDLPARLAELERTVEAHARALEVQLQRIAQLQADIDVVRGAWVKLKAPPTAPK